MALKNNKKQVFNLILLGDPGAGKATQGRRLVKKYPLREFDFGVWLRTAPPAIRDKYNLDQNVDRGNPAPTELAKKVFKDVILNTSGDKGVFFNGNPRLLGEARMVYKLFKKAKRLDPLVIYLSIPQAEMLKRINARKHQEKRKDDQSEEWFKNRMRYYRKHVAPTVDFFKDKYFFKKISGVGTEAEVWKRLDSAIKEGLKSINKEKN